MQHMAHPPVPQILAFHHHQITAASAEKQRPVHPDIAAVRSF
tara:strand:+ start:2560 stop:2685 length:126 start_codon:yes stop_codon:yes gene_type:complete